MKTLKMVLLLTVIVFTMNLISVSLPAGNQQKGLVATANFKGEYLGQEPPGIMPELFAPGILCTELDDWGITFFPKNDEIYYTVTGREQATIVALKFRDGKWYGPEVVPFSGLFFDYAPTISPDGTFMIFVSLRPISPEDKTKDSNLWICRRKENKWSNPVPLSSEINMDGENETWPSLASNGDLYFSANRSGGKGKNDIYLSKLVAGKYIKPINLGAPVNSEFGEYCPFIAPDQSYLIFEIVDKPGGIGGGDMYISYKEKNDSWGVPVNMGKSFNSRKHDCYPRISPDGKYFFFMSNRRVKLPNSDKRICYREIKKNAHKNGGWDIYWVDIEAIKTLPENKSKGLPEH